MKLTMQWAVLYRDALLQGGFAIYGGLVAIQYFITNSFILGALWVALTLWYLGMISDKIKSRQKIEAAARDIQAKIDAYAAQGYDVDEWDEWAIKMPHWSDLIVPGICWVIGVFLIYISYTGHRYVDLVAGIVLALIGVVGLYLFQQPDPLLNGVIRD